MHSSLTHDSTQRLANYHREWLRGDIGAGSILGWQKDDSIDRLTFSELNDRTSWT